MASTAAAVAAAVAKAAASSSSSTKIKLYGVPLSQPFRAVAWTLLQLHVPFDVVVTVPGLDASKPFSSRHVNFVSKTKGRTSTIPVLEEEMGADSSFCLSESPAILSYLCEARGNHHNVTNNNGTTTSSPSLYAPPGTRRKALLDSYMHWHHTGTRNLLALTVPYFRPDMTVTDVQLQQAHETLSVLETGWLSGGGDSIMIGGDHVPSIADILCYEEVVQATMTGLLPTLETSFPNVHAWLQRMEASLPYHDEAHAALTTLGPLVHPDGVTPIDDPNNMRKRLAAATKAGLAAYQKVQQSYMADSKL